MPSRKSGFFIGSPRYSEQRVALGINYTSTMVLDFGGKDFSETNQCFEGGLLVVTHQTGIPGHVRAQDGGQLAVGALGSHGVPLPYATK